MYARVVLGATKSVPFREVSSIQGCPYRGVPLYWCLCMSVSRVAQWERAGPITQRSMDRNHPLLAFLNIFLVGEYF